MLASLLLVSYVNVKKKPNVNIMFKRACSYVFYVAIYLSGIVIGGVYTPEVISYAKQANAQNELEERMKRNPQHIKKKTVTKPVQLG